ncbi:MAG: YbhB/YbcL family Raf kinase inhibitor-like protein [Natronomonas sp.]
MRRREFLATASAVAVGGCTIGGEPPERTFTVSAPAFEAELPVRFTCDGEGVSPPLVVDGIPDPASSVAVVGEWFQDGAVPEWRTLWLVWDLPAEPFELPEDRPNGPELDDPAGAIQGTNDEGFVGYRSPCHEIPGENSYRFVALAVESTPEIDPGANRDAFDDAIEPLIVASDAVEVRYERF